MCEILSLPVKERERGLKTFRLLDADSMDAGGKDVEHFEVIVRDELDATDIGVARFHPMEEYGAYFTVFDGELISCAMTLSGLPECDGVMVNHSLVTAPESSEFIEAVNAKFGTSFKFEAFAGR